jgi:hypothetical protein
MNRHRLHQLMWAVSVSLSAAIGAYACDESTTTGGVTGGAPNGGAPAAGGTGSAGDAAGCSCADGHCPTLQSFCAFLGTPNACPATIGELSSINQAEVGCGKRLVSSGPCTDSFHASYSFGETPPRCSTIGSSGLEQNCDSVVSCRSYGVGGALGLANCLPGSAGGGAGGSAGSG